MGFPKRKRFWIDSNVQGAMLVRLFWYWFFFVVAVAQVLLCWQIFNEPDGPFWTHFNYGRLWQQHGSVVIASLLLLPLLMIDAVIFSNRFTGPVYRLRRCIRALANGERVQPITFRKNDFRPEMADEFNALLAYVERLRGQAVSSPSAETVVWPKRQTEAEPQEHHEEVSAK